MSRLDEHTIRRRSGPIGYLGPKSSSFTLGWLATHRGRLHSLIFGSKRLTLLAIWDTKGPQTVPHSAAEVEALREIVYGCKHEFQWHPESEDFGVCSKCGHEATDAETDTESGRGEPS